ncbi:MAG: hypothetical protein A2840_00140 [Candidatus Buchananbacteria bacterium RIFCSPHIGHO2_01_FULL_47_11b]|uniref:acylphosphatase n=1 Tax=Candidatus Buchananbacteria bacterium RIFCSPHIGHO2_01_FULL_47_11b TaxID=1797537 RepID=A0A1G1Y609_9BACT|nr:MAG: hypothetical protein A2840_00140 [Candidatus Buchananbacteria bacterium RIFCSPHIGHO2_01_FULL_47_11b]
MTKRVTLRVIGLVQGVGYRLMSQKEAQRRQLSGKVRNRDNGSVEIIAEGDEAELKGFIQWCYTGVGPAQVHKIEEEWAEATGGFVDFVIES